MKEDSSSASKNAIREEQIMSPHAEIVRSIIRWALLILAADSAGAKLPLPRISQISLGRMLSRSDEHTCADIALDIVLHGTVDGQETVSSVMCSIRAGWGQAPPQQKSRRSGREKMVDQAERVMTALRRFGCRRERELIEMCCMLRSWRQAETILPGRSWSSVRDDFENLADRLWHKEEALMESVSEFIRESTRSSA